MISVIPRDLNKVLFVLGYEEIRTVGNSAAGLITYMLMRTVTVWLPKDDAVLCMQHAMKNLQGSIHRKETDSVCPVQIFSCKV
jgi:hypothetical protein